MQAFDYSRATTIDEATGLLQQAQGRARILAGGTDLLVALRERRLTTDLVIDVKSIAELTALRYDAETGLHIGSAAPCWRIYGDANVASLYPGMVDAVRQIGGVQIHGRASLGGNLCNASPAADAIPALDRPCRPGGDRRTGGAAHGAGRAVLHAGRGARCCSPRNCWWRCTCRHPSPHSGGAYVRFTPRNEMDISVVGAAAWVQTRRRGRPLCDGPCGPGGRGAHAAGRAGCRGRTGRAAGERWDVRYGSRHGTGGSATDHGYAGDG